MSGTLSFAMLVALIGDKIGEFAVACPSCGPKRKTPRKGKLKVFKVWRKSADFVTYSCAHCLIHGFANRDGAAKLSFQERAKFKAEAAKDAADYEKGQRE